MMQQKVHIFILAFLVMGLLFLPSAQEVLAGVAATEPFCCLSEEGCADSTSGLPIACQVGTIEENAICNENTGLCVSLDTIHEAIPTVSEWGLIAMAGILGIIGFIVIRRRKVAA
jgi:hypothetical protein